MRAKTYRVPQAYRAHMGVWFISIQAFAAAEGLGVCLELDVSFDSDDRLELFGLPKSLVQRSFLLLLPNSAAGR